MKLRLVLMIVSLGLFSCDKKEKKYYELLASINNSAHEESVAKLDDSLAQFNKFLDSNKIYDGKSFLSKTELSESVSFLNCIEDYKKILENKKKESASKAKWKSNLIELKNPLTLQKLDDPDKVIASVEDRIEKIDNRLKQVEVELSRKKISCDNAYSKTVSLSKSS